MAGEEDRLYRPLNELLTSAAEEAASTSSSPTSRTHDQVGESPPGKGGLLYPGLLCVAWGAYAGYHLFHGWLCWPLSMTLPVRIPAGMMLGWVIASAAGITLDYTSRMTRRITAALFAGTVLGWIPWVFWRIGGASGSLGGFIEHLPHQTRELHWLWAVGPLLTLALVLAASIPLTSFRTKFLYVVVSGLSASVAAVVFLGGWMYGDRTFVWQTLEARLPWHGKALALGFGLGVLFALGRLYGLRRCEKARLKKRSRA